MRTRFAVAALSALIVALALASAANAAFPTAVNGRIVFASSRDLPMTDSSDLFLMGADGSNPVSLTPGGGEVTSVDPSFSPDGTRILFSRPDGIDFDIFQMNADGSNPVNLTPTSPDTDGGAVFSPDSKRIAFGRDIDTGMNDQFDIFVANPDASGAINITPGRTTTNDFGPDFSPDGKRIIFRTFDGGDPDYFAIGTDGSNPVNLTAANPTADEDAVYTPDGKRIALARDMDPSAMGVDFDIVLVNAADGSNPVDITPDPAVDDRSPAPSPDGKRITFERDGDVFIANIDGSAPINLTGTADGRSPRWEYVYMCAGRRATIIGSDSPEKIKGTKRADVIVGNGGADKLVGRGGKDRICGGTGKDKLKGGAGNDRLLGQAGKDKLFGGKGTDRLKGGAGKDVEKQ